MPYAKTEPKANFPELEQQILMFWRENDTFHKSLKQTESGAPFTFYDGPPFANNLPHLGHLGVSSAKDMACRYQTMRGRHVVRELGWDCHGLPAELSVEKKQGQDAKKIVENEGLDKFCNYCRTDVMTYAQQWTDYINRIGRWVDSGENVGYRTMDTNYMESIMWALKRLYEKKLLFLDYRVNPYDWKMGTVLSNSEANQDYRDVIDDAITIWFEMEDSRRILAWTTTPWTLPANSALAVNADLKYAIMRDADGKEYIIAESRVATYEKQFADAQRVGDLMGLELVGMKYKPLFDYYDDEKLYRVISADYVSDSDGTGIVHIAPAFGEEDFWAVKKIDPKFPVIVNVGDYGNFTEDVRLCAGMNIFESNPKIIEYLKKAGFLVKKEQYKHSYPHGDRSGEKLIYRATKSWYLDVPAIQDRLIEITKTQTVWGAAGERFMRWIENARVWSISRNRFWGTPLPIWEKDGEHKIFGSIKEMEEFFGVKIDDLHRPTLDKLEKDGWRRIPDVLDCWFESGSMPFASLHFPFDPSSHSADDPELPRNFPADYIIEGLDQTRGWFYSLMVMAVALFDRPAFKYVSVNGMTTDENKKKMSKRLSNYENPNVIFDRYGADSIRLYLLGSNFLKAEPVIIDKEGKVFAEPVKNILTPLWNAYHFFTLYANAGGVTAQSIENKEQSIDNVLDRYILAELDELISVTIGALDEYKSDVAIRELTRFLEILNNWYIRRSKERFWDEEQSAFDTLHYVLTTLCKLLAPFAPFISDYIYRAITGAESVHLEEFPNRTQSTPGDMLNLITMRSTQEIVLIGRQLREKYGLRNRLPLSNLRIWRYGSGMLAAFTDIIADELNVKIVTDETTGFENVADSFVYLITPKIGARLGTALKDIIPAVKRGDYEIRDGELLTVNCSLLTDEYEFRLNVKPGVTGAALPDNTAVVVLDTFVTPELAAEGLARDALRFIQDSRKDAGLDVSDRIVLEYAADGDLASAIVAHSDMIKENALATELRESVNAAEFMTEIEGHKFGIKIEKM